MEPGAPRATFNGLEDDARVVVGDDVGVAVLGLVHFQVGMLPRELLARIDGLRGKGRWGMSAGRHWRAWESGRWGPAHLVLLGELEAVVGFEAFRVLGHVRDGDRRVAKHACRESRPRQRRPVTWGPAQGLGVGLLYSVSLRWKSCS